MRSPELLPEEIKLAVEQPDLMTVKCKEHVFYVKEIEGKGKLLVYAVKEDDHYDIQCADWLKNQRSDKMKLKVLSLPDLEQVRQWRNESLSSLRTPFLLNMETQAAFYRDVICNRQSNARYWGIWKDPKVDQRCDIESIKTISCDNGFIGMCGLENIQHENRLAEISLLLKPDYTIDANFPKVLRLLLHEAFMNMNLDNIYVEAYDCNPNLHLWLAAVAEYGCKMAMLPYRKYHNGHYWNSRYINFTKEAFLEYENTLLKPTQTIN